jgi:predicted ribosome quality control (RQC) complex YloA/Tae2 family protein
MVWMMSPDGITLSLIIKELNSQVLHGRVDRVLQPERLETILVIRKPGQNFRLLLSAHAENARLHLTANEKPNPSSPPLFCLVMRKHLEGGRLVGIQQAGLDRVVQFTFSHLGENGGYREINLICEIMGKHSNLILVEQSTGQILDAIKRYTHAVSRHREVLPGRVYIAPPAQKKEYPLGLDEERFIKILQGGGWEKTLEELVFKNLAGIGPELARELLFQANLPPDLRLEECGEYELRNLWQSLQKTIGPLLRGDYEPTLVLDGKNPVCYAPLPLTQHQGLTLHAAPSLNAAADTFYTGSMEIARFRQLQSSLANTVVRDAARVEKKLFLQQQSQADAKKSQDYRIRGEMLLAHLHLVERGQTAARLPNLYDQEAPPLEIVLDPSLTPSQNAQRLFRRYEKSRNTLKNNKLQMDQTMDEQRYLSSIKTALDLSETVEELNEIRAELEEAGYVKVKSKEKSKERKNKPQQKTLPQVSRFASAEGFEILIGKNNRQNEYLTMHMAKKEDIWLHAKDAPGAHVIIKSQPGREVPAAVLAQAARLAAYYSENRHSSKVSVDYASRKNVWKPAKARPGFVLYENYQTLLVNPQEN